MVKETKDQRIGPLADPPLGFGERCGLRAARVSGPSTGFGAGVAATSADGEETGSPSSLEEGAVWRRCLLRGRCRRVFQARRVLFGFRFFRGRWLNCSARISRSVAFRSAKELLRGRWLNCSARTFVETGVGRLRIDVQAGTRFVHRKRSTFAPVRSGHNFMSRFRLGAVGPSVGCRGMVLVRGQGLGLGGKSGVGRRSLSRTGFLLADIRFLIASQGRAQCSDFPFSRNGSLLAGSRRFGSRLNLFRRRRGPFGNRSKLPGARGNRDDTEARGAPDPPAVQLGNQIE